MSVYVYVRKTLTKIQEIEKVDRVNGIQTIYEHEILVYVFLIV